MFTCVSKYISTNEYLCIYIGFEKIAPCCQHPPKKIEAFHLHMSNANVKSIKWPGSIMHPGCAAFQAATRPWGSTRQTAKVKASTCLDHGHSQTQTRLNKSISFPMFVITRFLKETTPYATNKQGSKCGHKNSYKKMPPWHIPRSPCCSLATSTTTVFPHHAMEWKGSNLLTVTCLLRTTVRTSAMQTGTAKECYTQKFVV